MLQMKSTFGVMSAPLDGDSCGGASQKVVSEQDLRVRRISLFLSGVGYFERSGTVEGNASVSLHFKRDGLNDVLKSLIIGDSSGELRPATYAVPGLLTSSQRNDLSLPADQTLGSVLREFQGAKIAIVTTDKTVEGHLIGVVSKNMADENGHAFMVDEVEIANVLTDDGLQIVRLDKLEGEGKVLLLDPLLNEKLLEQLQRNAANLSSSVDDSYVPVTLQFDGNGQRTVTAAYMQGTSVWKVGYRLSFDSHDAAAKSTTSGSFLQGWSIVENTTNEDWDEVTLSLITGTPVSFSMDMSSPLYVRRNEESVPFARKLKSEVYVEGMDERNNGSDTSPRTGGEVRHQREESRMAATMMPAATMMSNRVADSSPAATARFPTNELMAQQANVTEAERGELFEYAIDQPVSLKRGDAAMIPIVSRAINAEKISVFNASHAQASAVNGLLLENTTGLYLAGGPLTIYEDGAYAGDAQMTDISAGESRLISYSLDGGLVISRLPDKNNSSTTNLKSAEGHVVVQTTEQITSAYEFHNKTNIDKKVVILIPTVQGFMLVKPPEQPSKSKGEYRFEIVVSATGNSVFEYVQERITERIEATVEPPRKKFFFF